MKVLAKLRRGVIEIAAGNDCFYAEPSFLQCAYLLWTFRNFRRLSVHVLNPRQRQIVERLSEVAYIRDSKRINPALVIGRAEFSALPPSKRRGTAVQPEVQTQHAAGGARPLRSVKLLTKLPRVLARSSAARAVAPVLRRRRSYARYSLVLTLAGASLVIITGAVGQRLWINRSKSAPLPAESPASSLPFASQQASSATKPQPAQASLPTARANITPTAKGPVAAAALHVSPPTISAPAARIETITPAKVIYAKVLPLNAEAGAANSPLRVFLAPRNVIYPSIPISGSPAGEKKSILVKAIVNTRGTVDHVQVPGEGPSLAAAIAKTVRQWRYQPYVRNGQPVAVETRMVFTVLGPDAITVRFLPAGEKDATE